MTATTTRARTAVTMRRRVLGFTVAMLRGRYGGAMRELRLFAISINDVRDIFGAHPALAARLRQLAATEFAPPARARSLLDRIGPLLSRNRSVEIDPRQPLAGDVDALLSGGHIQYERLPQSWDLMLLWLTALATRSLSLTVHDLDGLEFDLARAGLPSDFSLRQLAERELGIALRPLPGQVVGYSKHAHVRATHDHLRRVHDEAPPNLQGAVRSVEPLLGMLEGIAMHPGAPLDLVVVQRPTAGS